MNRVSVVVPVYNTAAYLRACLDSILAQSVPPFEVILVDDGSSDGSGQICDEYARRHPERVRVIHQPNRGTAAARNRGLEACRGEYLSFIDSDDYLEPEMYERLLELIEAHGADMAAAEMWVEKTDGSRYCRVKEGISRCWTTREALLELNSYRYLHASFCTALIRRETMGALRFPEGQCEDYALLYRVMAACGRVAYTSRPLYHYVQRPNSNSRTTRISQAPMEISRAQVRFFRERFPGIAYAAEADCAFAHMGVFTAYARSGQICPRELTGRLRAAAWRFLPAVLRHDRLPAIKKAQAAVFCLSPTLYGMIVAGTEHR